MAKETPLRPATQAELEYALSHALCFDGRKAFKVSGEMMAKITAAHLAEQLRISGFVVMKKPPVVMATSTDFGIGSAGLPPFEG